MLFDLNLSFTRGSLSGVYTGDFCCYFFRGTLLIISAEYVWKDIVASDIRAFSAMSPQTFLTPEINSPCFGTIKMLFGTQK